MPTISEIRNGLATNLGTIPGLRTAAFVPDEPKPPGKAKGGLIRGLPKIALRGY